MENNPIIPSAFEGDERERIEEHLMHLSHHAKKHEWLSDNEANITLSEIEDPSSLSPERAKVVQDFFEHYDKKSVGYLKLIEIQGDPIVFKTIKIVREAREKIAKALERTKKTPADTLNSPCPAVKKSETPPESQMENLTFKYQGGPFDTIVGISRSDLDLLRLAARQAEKERRKQETKGMRKNGGTERERNSDSLVILQDSQYLTQITLNASDDLTQLFPKIFDIDITHIINTDDHEGKRATTREIMEAVNRFIPTFNDSNFGLPYNNVLSRAINALFEVSLERKISDERRMQIYAPPFCAREILEKYLLYLLLELRFGKRLHPETTYQSSLKNEIMDVCNAEPPQPIIHLQIQATPGDIKDIRIAEDNAFPERKKIIDLMQAYDFTPGDQDAPAKQLLCDFLRKRLKAVKSFWWTRTVKFEDSNTDDLLRYLIFALHEGIMTNEQKTCEYGYRETDYLITETIRRKGIEKGPDKRSLRDATMRRVALEIHESLEQEIPGQILKNDDVPKLGKTLILLPDIAQELLVDDEGNFVGMLTREDLGNHAKKILSGGFKTVTHLAPTKLGDIAHSGHSSYTVNTNGTLTRIEALQEQIIVKKDGELHIVNWEGIGPVTKEIYRLHAVVQNNQALLNKFLSQLKRKNQTSERVQEALARLEGNKEARGIIDFAGKAREALETAIKECDRLKQWTVYGYKDQIIRILLAYEAVHLAMAEFTESAKDFTSLMATINSEETGIKYPPKE